jgi:hypothetical protein
MWFIILIFRLITYSFFDQFEPVFVVEKKDFYWLPKYCDPKTNKSLYFLCWLTGGAPNIGSNPLRLLTTQPQQMPTTPPIFSSSNSNTPQNSLGKDECFYCCFSWVFCYLLFSGHCVRCVPFGVTQHVL